MIEVKALTEETQGDAERVVHSRFGENGVAILRKAMRNPMRRVCVSAGDLAYEDGRPASLQGTILRKLHWCDEAIVGTVGGLTASIPGSSEAAYVDVQLASYKPKGGSVIGFGNSANANSALVARKNKKIFLGPESCTRYLWRAIRPLECLSYFVRRKVLKSAMPRWKPFGRLPDIAWDEECGGGRICRVREPTLEFFDVLMARYLKTNQGLVCSRTAEEIDWIFGEWIRTGEVVVLGAFDGEGPAGYILLKTDAFAKRWKIHDWFAVENRADILEPLLASACRFLKKRTPAMMLEVEGFPTWVQPMLKKYLPQVREVGFNQFSWGSRDKEFKAKVMPIIDSPKSWFFGPYDGDECMS